MSFDHKIRASFTEGSNTAAGEVMVTTESSIREDVAVPANTTNMEVDLDFVAARAKAIFIVSDRAVTLKTNSTSSPGNTIALQANVPIVYASGMGANPFTTDVTTLYITNAASAGGPEANVKIRIGYDPTP